MENFYDVLRISIRSILSPMSEETVIGIIHAIQNAGFEALSDLQFMQENDFMSVLKPIPRRKLIKMWNNPGVIEELKCEYERKKNEDMSRQIDEFLAEAKKSSESTTNSVTVESITELLKTNICRILNSVSEESLDDIINALKFAGLELLLDLKFVREDDLTDVLKPIQRRKLVKAWSQQSILFLFSNAPIVVREPTAADHNTHEDSSAASSLSSNNVSSSIHDLTMPTQRQAYIDETFDPSLLESSSGVHGLNYKFYGPWLSGLLSGIPDLIDQDPLPHEPLPVAPDLTDQDPLPHGPPLGVPDRDPLPPGPPPGVPDLTDHDPLPTGSPPAAPDLTDQDPLPHESPRRVSSFISVDKSIHPVKSSNLPSEKCNWNRSKHYVLLQVCAKYKKELSCPGVKKNCKVWRKIAEEVNRKFYSLRCHKDRKSHLLINESECMDKIEMLRDQYHAQKNKKVLNGKMSKVFKMASIAFETTENSVTTLAELPSSVSVPSFNWLWNKRLALLRLYAIFKTELSSSIIKEQHIWKKIAEKVGKSETRKCNAKQCQNQIKSMKFEYEEMKCKRPHELNHVHAVFLDEAENAFENIENPVVFSVQSDLEKWTMSKPDRVKLLQVYSKYKAELSLQNFDVENQIVWGKVSREISKKCSSFYGKRRCFYEINRLKHLDESFIKENRITRRKPYYFFDEAKKVFESADCSDTYMQKAKKSYCDNRARRNHTHLNTEVQNAQRIVVQNTDDVLQREAALSGQHGEVNSLKDFTVNQKRRSWYEHISI